MQKMIMLEGAGIKCMTESNAEKGNCQQLYRATSNKIMTMANKGLTDDKRFRFHRVQLMVKNWCVYFNIMLRQSGVFTTIISAGVRLLLGPKVPVGVMKT